MALLAGVDKMDHLGLRKVHIMHIIPHFSLLSVYCNITVKPWYTLRGGLVYS